MSSGAFGDETESTVLHEVDCFGNETDIFNCSVSTFGLPSEHSASVICQGVFIKDVTMPRQATFCLVCCVSPYQPTH